MLPGVCAYVSQIDLPLPSSFQAPSIWYDEVPTPQKNPLGNWRPVEGWLVGFCPGCGRAASLSLLEQPAATAPIAALPAAFAKSRREIGVDIAILLYLPQRVCRHHQIARGRRETLCFSLSGVRQVDPMLGM